MHVARWLPMAILATAALTWSACATGATGAAPAPAASRDPSHRSHRSPLSPLSHDAYVWQRAWTPAVRRAVLTHGPSFRRLVVLAAEVGWDHHQRHTARAQVDFDTLREAIARSQGRLRVGLALRVGPWDPSQESHAHAGRALAALAADVVARARAAGLQPAELDVDYDAPTAGLAVYARWLRQLRPALGGVPLTITALPAWLDSPALPAVLAVTDGWVLQVHSLERPRAVDPKQMALPPLTDSTKARAWVAQAARLSATLARARRRPLPLRVALPTYGYEVGFRPDGTFLGLRAEAPLYLRGLPGQRWPPGTIVRALRADAPTLSALVRGWTRARAAGHLAPLTGLAWYRLPVSTDRLTWRWITLQAVMAGHPVAPRVVVALEPGGRERGEGSVLDLVATNAGLADAPLPARVVVTAPEPVVFAEALAGYTLAPATRLGRRYAWIFRRAPTAAAKRLAPSGQHRIGWLRLTPGASRDAVQLEASPPVGP